MSSPLILALPKGRIQNEMTPLLAKAGIEPESAFSDDASRQLQFRCKGADIKLIRVRSFDVATFVAFGGAHMGICGSDVLAEFDYNDIYAPLDLNIGHCRLSVAMPVEKADAHAFARASHVRVATKYPRLARQFFADKGIQAECITLSGAMELAPGLGLAPCIVDLISSGKTLSANGLAEVEKITDVSSRLIVGRTAFKTCSADIVPLVERFREVVHAASA